MFADILLLYQDLNIIMANNLICHTLSTINSRINKEIALANNQIHINLQPDFQRDFESWDDKMKTRLIETMLIGRAMNPIWLISNSEEETEEVLDGMHRLNTALDFLNNKYKLIGKYFHTVKYKEIDGKYFKDLDFDIKQRIRNYNFMFNLLDSSYRTDVNKRRDMYEILNRSSRTLNEYEFNKVLYKKFYDIITDKKEKFKGSFLDKVKDKRGGLDTEIISMIVLSEPLNKNWCSINSIRDKWYSDNLGNSNESVDTFLSNNSERIRDKLDNLVKIINYLSTAKFFTSNNKDKKTYYVPYKFICSRLLFKCKTISLFNRHIDNMIKEFNARVIKQNIDKDLECNTRNATFQRKLIELIDSIIDTEIDIDNPENKRIFPKKMIDEIMLKQEKKCNSCNQDIIDGDYEADHIIPWTNGGKTIESNLQILHKRCHQIKSN